MLLTWITFKSNYTTYPSVSIVEKKRKNKHKEVLNEFSLIKRKMSKNDKMF